jgi:HAD superfamily hydrolase (TIGR01490 family)
MPLAIPESSIPESAAPPGVAIFDFDDTLIHGDSLLGFLDRVAGWLPVRLAVFGAVFGALIATLAGRPPGADFPGSVKALLLRLTLAGVPVAKAETAARKLAPRLRWRAAQVDALRAHAAAGQRVVVVSGALDVYLSILLEGLPVSKVLPTRLESRDGRLTGRLDGPNCVRLAKADCIRAFLTAHAPCGPTWGYGNRPHDLPMLALVDRPTVV